MIYKEFKGMKISSLGMGAMRLPVLDGDDTKIDEEATKAMVAEAFAKGVTYFDTAWGYHGGNSEIILGKALADYPRDSFTLADKFPGYDLANMSKVEEIFNKQLEKCGVEYFDFYMYHNVCELNIDEYLNEEYGIHDFLMKMKGEGKIKHLGFSAHGEYPVIKKFLEAHGEDMEFIQLQINYLDYRFQHGKKKMELAAEYDLPVIVMEPMRGGKLAKLNDSQEARLKALRPDESIPAWAHRFLQDLPQVMTVLTGASDIDQLKDNLKSFDAENPLKEEEHKVLSDIVDEMISEKTVPCTGCNYCAGRCPMGLDIPRLIGLYNEHNITGGGFIAPFVLRTIPEDKWPNKCIGCGKCQLYCPQQIEIWQTMGKFANAIEN